MPKQKRQSQRKLLARLVTVNSGIAVQVGVRSNLEKKEINELGCSYRGRII